MKSTKLSLLLILLLIPAISCADEYYDKVKIKAEIQGCWKRINFPEAVMKNLNKSEPYPLEHQWYCFLEDGKYWELHSNNDKNSKEEILRMMKIFPGQEYSIIKEGIILLHHKVTNQNTYWVTSILSKDLDMWGVNLKQGGILMTIRDPSSGKDTYYRFLKKLNDF